MVDDPRYREYLERCDRALGDVAVGGYAKFEGKLIKKLTVEEFRERDREFTALGESYQQILTNGHTINNVLVRVLREHASELLLPSPA